MWTLSNLCIAAYFTNVDIKTNIFMANLLNSIYYIIIELEYWNRNILFFAGIYYILPIFEIFGILNNEGICSCDCTVCLAGWYTDFMFGYNVVQHCKQYCLKK